MGDSRRTRRVIAAIVTAGAVFVGPIVAAGADAPDKHQVIVGDDFSSGSIRFVVDGIDSVMDASSYKISFANNSIGPHVLIAYKIPNGWTEADLLAALSGEPPEGAFEAGAVFAKPGQDHQKQFDLTTTGTYGYFCPIQTPSGRSHYELGFLGVFEVE